MPASATIMQWPPAATSVSQASILTQASSFTQASILIPSSTLIPSSILTPSSSFASGPTIPPSAPDVDSIPHPIGLVNDFESLFTQTQRDSLTTILTTLRQNASIQIAVLTVDAEMTTSASFDNFTVKVFNTWGIGDAKTNNGILVAISRSLRKIRIQKGSGIEKRMSKENTKDIIDTAFIPDFKKSRFYEGTVNGLKAILQQLAMQP